MNPSLIPDNKPVARARLARTVKGLDGRLRHVETLLAAKPLRGALDLLAADVRDLVTRLAALDLDLKAKIHDVASTVGALGDRLAALETMASDAARNREALGRRMDGLVDAVAVAAEIDPAAARGPETHVATMTPEAAEALAALPEQREAERKRQKAERDARYRAKKKAEATGETTPS